jgi:hypothetical protein
MKLKIIQPKNTLPCEGELHAVVKAVKPKGDTKALIELTVVCEAGEFVVSKEYLAKLDSKSELFKDAQSILGRPFNENELADSFDLATLEKLPCRVVVAHKRTSGGKTAAVVTTVLPKV